MYSGLGQDDFSSALSLIGDPSSSPSSLIGAGSMIVGDVVDMFLPGVGSAISVVGQEIGQMFKIGAGRTEADHITPSQNTMMNYLGQITNLIRTGQNPTVYQLQSYYLDVIQVAQQFIKFVSSTQFTDRRASGQALNTVMPYVDGSCGYPVPLPPGTNFSPSQHNCLSWGDGTIGGVGQNGMLGAIQRAIVMRGGTLPAPALMQSPVPTIGIPGINSVPQPGLLPAMPATGAPLGAPPPIEQLGVGGGGLDWSTVLLAGAAALLFLGPRGR